MTEGWLDVAAMGLQRVRCNITTEDSHGQFKLWVQWSRWCGGAEIETSYMAETNALD